MITKDTGQGGVDRSHGKSTPEKTVFILGHLSILLLGVWLSQLGGFSFICEAMGISSQLSDPTRADILLACMFLYWARHTFTVTYLLARRLAWSEVLGLLFFFAFFELSLLLVGGGAFREAPTALGKLDVFALCLLLTGSLLNSLSELQRKRWKSNPENKGHCYTKGLFQYSMHINYFGDTLLFLGWCLLAANLWTLILPAFMAASFVFYHIPALDSYLEKRYGEEFRVYSQKTKKFVPFLY